jgi:hypothetical protein
VPIGATVQITCKGKKCPFKRKRITAKSAVVKLVAVFKKRRMPAGTRLEIRVTKAGTIGKVVTFTLQKKKTPKRTDRCLAIGATKPSKC